MNSTNQPHSAAKLRRDTRLNPYARIITDEARRRDIEVKVLDVEAGYFSLTFRGRTIVCRESLSELTTAVAMSRCDDKAVTIRLLAREGLRVPSQVTAAGDEDNKVFLVKHKHIVVKPARGEQGNGVSVDITDVDDMNKAIEDAHRFSNEVLLEEYMGGEDLRVVVIDSKVVAGAIRRPPMITGDGKNCIVDLIKIQSKKREQATDGESHIPIDGETERCIKKAGYSFSSILPKGEELIVRKTDNLHTGATIEDVTPKLHPDVRDAAICAAQAINIPVVGVDLIVPAVDSADYVVIEANERPGLANHEPQPTAQRFIDFLFPETASV